MNKQEIYNKVKAALLEQGCQSIDDSGESDTGTCMYRGSDGKKCGIGHLILDEHYSPELEGKGCHTMDVIAALRASGIDPKDHTDTDFLIRLQGAHDYVDTDFVPEFTERMARVAKEYNLEE